MSLDEPETQMAQRPKLQYHQERAAQHRELANASSLEIVRDAHLAIAAYHVNEVGKKNEGGSDR